MAGPQPGRPPALRLTRFRLFWGLLLLSAVLLLLRNFQFDTGSSGSRLGELGSHDLAHDLVPFPGAADQLQVKGLNDLSAQTTDLLAEIRHEQLLAQEAAVKQVPRRQQPQREVALQQPKGGQAGPAGNLPLSAAAEPSRLSLMQPALVKTAQRRDLPALVKTAGAVGGGGDPFSGVPGLALEAEKETLASAVKKYRGGAEYKKHKSSLEAYRKAIHKYKAAREARRRPYPPEPKAPPVTLPALPATQSLAAKCFAAAGSADGMGKKFQGRVTIMNREAYKPKDLIVTWVRTVGAVSEDFWDALPATDPFAGVRYSTCAVVGSAGLLRTRRFGAQIDAHDAVFRFNSAYTTGLETYVGRKTTVRLMNRENFGFVGDPSEIVLQHITTADMMSDFVAYRRLRPEARLYAIHPAFYGRVITEEVEHPSNGYFGMRLALELCDCVRVYGFIRTWEGYMTYHYHDDYTPRKSQHNRDSSELPLIKGLLIDNLGRLAFAHPCILSSACEGCPDRAAACQDEVPYPVPTAGHCYGHGPPGGYPVLNPWEAGKFWPEGMEAMGGSAPKAKANDTKPYKPGMNEQKPFLPFADERRSCFRECVPGDTCPGGAGGVCPDATAKARPCLPWRDVSAPLQQQR